MSRSRRSAPIVPMTAAESDKAYKARAHRAERAAVRARLNKGEEPPSPRAFGDPCGSEKDGKQYLPDADELLRK